MRYLAIWRTAERNAPPSQEEMERMNGFIQEMLAEGSLIATEGCLPSALGARVRREGERVTVTDGPFTESKEVVGGFALLEARDRAHAIELTKRFVAVAGDGESEIRALYDASAAAPGDCSGAEQQVPVAGGAGVA